MIADPDYVGHLPITGTGEPIKVGAPGYRQASFTPDDLTGAHGPIRLHPFEPHAL